MWFRFFLYAPVLLGAGFLTDALQHLLDRCNQLASLGATGFFLFVGVYVLSSLFCMPCLPFTLLAGAVFGVKWGICAVFLGLAGGSSANFLLARHFGRGALARRLLARPRLALVDQAVAREGWQIVALLRLCPIPFGFSNYVYGLTAIEFWHYLGASMAGLMPGTAVFVYLGSAGLRSLESVSEGSGQHPLQYVLLGLTVVAAILVFAIVGRIVKRVVVEKVEG